jgi:hypothetical protein
MANVGIDFAAAGGVDLDRLERSLRLDGRRIGEGQYHVVGGDHDHCDCGDHLWRERICKHILAALLREGNDTVVRALGLLFERLKAA